MGNGAGRRYRRRIDLVLRKRRRDLDELWRKTRHEIEFEKMCIRDSLRRVPGVLAFVGCRNPQIGATFAQHSCFFKVDESVLVKGSMVAAQYLSLIHISPICSARFLSASTSQNSRMVVIGSRPNSRICSVKL